MARGLTDIAIKNLKAGPARREIPDPGARGLYVIVQPSGHKSFAVRYRFKGQPKKLSLGTVSLAAARKAAAAALHEVEGGRDPSVTKQHQKVEKRMAAANTFRAVAENYLRLVCGMRRGDDGRPTFGAKLRTAPRRLAELERLVFPSLGHRPVAEIKRSEIVALLDKIDMGELVGSGGKSIEGGPVAADRTLALISAILRWHESRSDDYVAPLARNMKRASSKDRARDRILSDDELQKVWRAASELPGPYPAFAKFLLLTGARRDEAARMTWAEIKDGIWTLPAGRNKVKCDLARPLSAAALAVIEPLQRGANSQWVFSVTGAKPIAAFGEQLEKLRAASGTAAWHFHDLRRTARSFMARAGIHADIAERALGHVVGGVRSVYDRHDYRAEMQHAYDALAAQIDRIVNPAPNVVPMARH